MMCKVLVGYLKIYQNNAEYKDFSIATIGSCKYPVYESNADSSEGFINCKNFRIQMMYV
jgi:hypothetical protein